jgi:hypothetical protein
VLEKALRTGEGLAVQDNHRHGDAVDDIVGLGSCSGEEYREVGHDYKSLSMSS